MPDDSSAIPGSGGCLVDGRRLPRLGHAGLHRPETAVEAVGVDQLVVGPGLDDPAPVEDPAPAVAESDDEDDSLVEEAPQVPLRAVFSRFWPHTRGFRGRMTMSLLLTGAVPALTTASLYLYKVLVDDVLTTGATGGACATALLEAGAEAVGLLTAARAVSSARRPRPILGHGLASGSVVAPGNGSPAVDASRGRSDPRKPTLGR